MDKFPTSTDYFSDGTGSQGSSSTVTPWAQVIPRSVPSLENMPLSDEGPLTAPPPYNYTHGPSDKTGRLPTKARNSDDFSLAVNKTGGTGKRSRFSEFFRWNASVASQNNDINVISQHGEGFGIPERTSNRFTPAKDIWNMDQLQSAVQPVNPRFGNLVPFLERSVWCTNSDEMARHVRTTSEEKQYEKQLAPIGTPAPKPSTITATQPPTDLFHELALSEQEIREVLSKNWEAPGPNPLTGREVTWLMRLHPNTKPPTRTRATATAAASIAEAASAIHSRHVSADSSLGSLSPEPSSSLIVSGPNSSPATSTSTVAQAQAQAKLEAEKAQSIRFTNSEAQAQQQREIAIAIVKEHRAREAAFRSSSLPITLPAPGPAPGAAPAPASSLMAAAPPFVPTVAEMGMVGVGEGPPGLSKEEWVDILERKLQVLKGALDIVGGSEAGGL